MCNKIVKDIVLRLRRDLKLEGHFTEETLGKITKLDKEKAESVARVYGLHLNNLPKCGEELEGLLRAIDKDDDLVLDIVDCLTIYFRTGHRMYYKEGKLCLACPLQQKISMVNIHTKEDVSRGVNNLMDIVREDCPKQQFHAEDASRILCFERNVEKCVK